MQREPRTSCGKRGIVASFKADVEQAERDFSRAQRWDTFLRIVTLGLLDNRRRVRALEARLGTCRAQLRRYEAQLERAAELDALLPTLQIEGVRVSKHTFADVPVDVSATYPVDWDELRDEVLARDRHECQQADGRCSGPLQIHHRRPLSKGGSNRTANLVTLCLFHHCLKHPHMRGK